MTNNLTPSVLLQSSPHMVSPVNSTALMRNVLIALMPVSAFGVIIFGLPALLNIVVAVVSAVVGESLFRLMIKRPVRANDCSAAITGLLLALIVPPNMPLWKTALGAIFAVVVAKEFFGGLGANVFNPALIGRAFLIMSFPESLTTWQKPVLPLGSSFGNADVVTGATPLAITKPMEGLPMGGGIAEVGQSLFEAGIIYSDSYWSIMNALFFGFRAGSTGETSIFLILASFLFLLVTKTVNWQTPVSMITAGFLTALVLWQDPQFALFSVLTGGLVFGAVFMATDYVTSPITGRGRFIFGTCAGIIAIIIRRWGIYPEGVCYAILIMNGVTPFLNRLLTKKYGFVPGRREAVK